MFLRVFYRAGFHSSQSLDTTQHPHKIDNGAGFRFSLPMAPVSGSAYHSATLHRITNASEVPTLQREGYGGSPWGRIDRDHPDNHTQQEASTQPKGLRKSTVSSSRKPIQGIQCVGLVHSVPALLLPLGRFSSLLRIFLVLSIAATECLSLLGPLAKAAPNTKLNFTLQPPTCQVHSWIHSRLLHLTFARTSQHPKSPVPWTRRVEHPETKKVFPRRSP